MDTIERTRAVYLRRGGRFRLKGTESLQVLDGWRDDLVSHFAILWEASAADPRWADVGLLELGVRKGRSGRARSVSTGYLDALSVASSNSKGLGVRTVRQLVTGMNATSRHPRRLTFAQKVARKGKLPSQERTAISLGSKHVSASHADYLLSGYELINYFHSCRPICELPQPPCRVLAPGPGCSVTFVPCLSCFGPRGR